MNLERRQRVDATRARIHVRGALERLVGNNKFPKLFREVQPSYSEELKPKPICPGRKLLVSSFPPEFRISSRDESASDSNFNVERESPFTRARSPPLAAIL